MKILIRIALIAISTACFSQKPPVKFGDVTVAELKMARYEKDTSAAALILVDFGESSLDYKQGEGFSLNFERTRRVKILTKDGYDWGNFTIPLYVDGSDEEKVTSLKAVTYNLEKEKIVETKMKNDAVFKEESDKYHKLVKLALSNVREGSVIEITYKVTSPFLFNFQDWDFQSTIPVAWSEYRTHIPEYFQYKKLVQGYVGMSVNEVENKPKSINLIIKDRSDAGYVTKTTVDHQSVDYFERYERLAAKDVPAFKIEPRITTYRDYISRITYELNTIKMPNQMPKMYNNTWEGLSNDYLENSSSGGVIGGSSFLKDYVEKVIAGKTDSKEKIAAVYDFVKENILWDGSSRKYSDENLKRVLENKKGSSAEINLMLVSMLQKADLKASPVLISTRDHGIIRKDNPISGQFNYVIAAVELDGKYILIDATERSLPMKTLPERCLNGEGYLVRAERPEWIKIDPIKSRATTTAELSLSEDGVVKGQIKLTYDGYYAQGMRRRFVKSGKEEYTKDFAASHAWEINSSEFENVEKLNEAVSEKYQITLNDHVQVAGDHMYFNPLLVGRLQENPFKLEVRQYPVDFGSPEEEVYASRITLPDGWTIEELPKTKIFVLPSNSAKCTYSVTQIGNVVSITSQLTINKALFVQPEYPSLRDFYSMVVAKHAEQIVLKKN